MLQRQINDVDCLKKIQSHNQDLNIIIDYMSDGTRSECAMVYGTEETGFDFSGYL